MAEPARGGTLVPSEGLVDWLTVGGRWGVAPDAIISEASDRQVYHSPQTPGWTAWTTLCKLDSGDLLMTFTQVTGDTKRKPSYNFRGLRRQYVFLRSRDGARTWEKAAAIEQATDTALPSSFNTLLQLPSGRLLATLWGRDLSPQVKGCSVRLEIPPTLSRWQSQRAVNDPAVNSCAASRLHRLRDGTLVLSYEGRMATTPHSNAYHHAGIYVSSDDGKTWQGPHVVAATTSGLVALPEPDFVELADGSLLFILRVEQYPGASHDHYFPGKRRQVRVARRGDKWVPGPVEETVLPHGGHPDLLRTRDGIVAYHAAEGIWTTMDEGRTWVRQAGPHPVYYPYSVEMSDGRVAVSSHVGGDFAFPPQHDTQIRCLTYRPEKTLSLVQRDRDAEGTALAPAAAWSDGSIEVLARGPGRTGLILRAQVSKGAVKGCTFVLGPDGACAITQRSGGETAALAEGKVSLPAQQWQHLRFTARGPRLTGFVNGREALSAQDTSPLPGQAGCVAEGAAWFTRLRRGE